MNNTPQTRLRALAVAVAVATLTGVFTCYPCPDRLMNVPLRSM